METTGTLTSAVAAALVAAAALAASSVQPAAAGTGAPCAGGRALLASGGPSVVQTLARPTAVPAAYDWPVAPFDRQHPVRANLDDPRIGHEGGTSFHFGIDIAVPDGTPVYAVASGVAYVAQGHVAVASSSARVFGYWHVRAAVANHQAIARHQLIGHVIAGWEHVHFAESVNGVYLNPLRPGGIGPYGDRTAPTIAGIDVERGRNGFTVIANAYDTPSIRVPGAWADEPVTPALLRWRVTRLGAAPAAWRTAVDFRSAMLDRSRFGAVYAPETRQNHKGEPGRFCFFLGRSWKPADGRYRIEVAAVDTRGNRAVARLDVEVVNGGVRS